MRYGEPWAECYICGFDYPQSQLSKHYKTMKLVCHRCTDQPGHTDFVEKQKLEEESPAESLQPVKDQGEV